MLTFGGEAGVESNDDDDGGDDSDETDVDLCHGGGVGGLSDRVAEALKGRDGGEAGCADEIFGGADATAQQSKSENGTYKRFHVDWNEKKSNLVLIGFAHIHFTLFVGQHLEIYILF